MYLDIDAVVIEVTDDNVAFDIVCQANIQRKEPRPSELSKNVQYILESKEKRFSRPDSK